MGINSHLFKFVFEFSKSGMIILGRRGELLYHNEAFREMVGLSEEELCHHRIQEFFKQDFVREFDSHFFNLISGDSGHFQMEVPYPAPEGNDRWWLIELTRGIDRERQKRFIFGIVQDITEGKEGQQKLINDKELAERATRVKSDFLANMSHEIRTPIHTIIGMNELLLETKLDAEQQEYSEQVKFAADVLLSLINDILDFSKIEAGKLTLEEIEFDLHTMVEDAVDLISLEAHKKGLEAALLIEQDVPYNVIGDPVRLRQIIVNLFNNAIKFTKDGEIVVTIKNREELEDRYILHFEVADTGIGIPKEKLGKLFQAFSQIDTSTTRKFGGTGLGLSISKNLVHLMDGRIGVDSQYSEGSTFWFDIKLGKTDGEQVPKKLPEGYDPIKGLVVDDNDTARRIASYYVQEWGGEVDEAYNGSEALEKLKTAAGEGSPYNLCVVDLLMPGMDGWQFASEVNADKNINSAKLVLLSPTGKSGEEAKMKLLGWYDAYLSKPLKKGDFYEALLRIMSSEVDLEAVEEVEELQPEKEPTPIEERHGLILVAEDHEVNQTLFKTILENMGNEVHIANNGVEALQASEENDYAVIFMDVQMPEMNGYEATEKIREKGIATPIIAATASGIKSEQEKCFSVGMDDILLKPFKKKDIIPLLMKWLPDTSPGPAPAASSSLSPPSDNDEIFNYQEAVSTFMGKEDVVKRVLQSFIDKVNGQVPLMTDSFASGDMEKLRGEAHSIKGGAWNLEIKRVGDAAKELEDSSREERVEDSRQNFEELKRLFQEFLDYVQPIIEKETSPS